MARSKSLKLLREDNRLRCQRHASVEQPIGCRKAQGVPYPSGLRRAIWCGSSAKFAAVTRGDLGQLSHTGLLPGQRSRRRHVALLLRNGNGAAGTSGERASTGQFSAVNAGARGTTCQPLSCPPFTKLRFWGRPSATTFSRSSSRYPCTSRSFTSSTFVTLCCEPPELWLAR